MFNEIQGVCTIVAFKGVLNISCSRDNVWVLIFNNYLDSDGNN